MTEQYFLIERSTARRTLVSSAPSPRTVKWKAMAMRRRGSVSRRIPCTAISSASSLMRCFWRMMTTSDAVQVAAARSSVSTGDVAARESPSTRIGGRPFPSPSNCSCCFHRTATSAVRATSISSPRRQTHIETVAVQLIQGPVFHEPVEGGAVMQLEAEREIGPEIGAVGIGGTALASRDRETQTHVRCGDLFIRCEPPEDIEAADVGVRPIEDADLSRWPQPNPIREQIAHVQRGAEHELTGAAQVHPAAHPEAEETEARAAVRRALGSHELLRGHEPRAEQSDRCHDHDAHQGTLAVRRAAVRP